MNLSVEHNHQNKDQYLVGIFTLYVNLLHSNICEALFYISVIQPIPTSAPVPCAANTREIAVGPDGALWLTDATNGIDRVTTNGQVSTYPLTNSNQVGKITKGPDGNMWFAHGNLIGTITMSGSISEKTTPSGVFIQGITTGPDNAIWYVGGTVVGKVK